jgi:hypothetical protein
MLKDLIEAAKELPKHIVNSDTLAEYTLPPLLAKNLREKLGFDKFTIGSHTSSLITSLKDNNFAVIPNQYFTFACYFYDFSGELMKYFRLIALIQKRCSELQLDAAQLLFGTADKINPAIASNTELRDCFEDLGDIALLSRFLDQDDSGMRLGAKNLINSSKGKYSARSIEDGFGSVVMTRINLANASASIFGDLVYALACNRDVFEQLKIHHDECASSEKTGPSEPSLDSHKKIPKPFLLLAGISGTGKTRFVREQAALHRGAYPSNFCLVPVRPDWHEPTDLLGYVSRIGASGSPRYVVTDLLRFLVRAWIDAAALPKASATVLFCNAPKDMTPYWLCLDEMNLAPVEQYFADYLSVVETRNWQGEIYTCDPLLKADTIAQLDADGQKALREDLGLDDEQFDGLWAYFIKVGVPLPPNLIVAGTVNMDETAHGFSRKVIDRAFTVDFGVFYPNDFAEFFDADKKYVPKALSFPVLSRATETELAGVPADPSGLKSVEFMAAINSVLKGTPFELAYRALNELLLAVTCFQPKDDAELQAVWDDFLMSKVLPRIEGDAEKLGFNDDGSLLTRLLGEIEKQCKDIFASARLDLLREEKDGSICMVNCRSKQKLDWMQERLRANGFTAFWP